MTEPKFKVGAVVRLPSGGPAMTVVKIDKVEVWIDDAGNCTDKPVRGYWNYHLGWFCKDDQIRSMTIPEDALVGPPRERAPRTIDDAFRSKFTREF